MNCKQCNAQVRVDDLTCSGCGAALPQPKVKVTGPTMPNISPQEKQDALTWFKKGVECHKNHAFSEAIRAYEQAASLGEARAQNNLGNLYEYGLGVQKDFQKAFSYYLLAAKQGNVTAQRNVAHCYKTGKGTETDFIEAVSWLMTAAAQDDVDACATLAQYYREYGNKSDKLERVWREKAAALHDSESLFWMGEFYLRGGENRNLALAEEYLDKAASFGTPQMMLKVADRFCAVSWNEENPLSLPKAKHWYQMAADCDDNSIRLRAAAGLDVKNEFGAGTVDGLDVNKAFLVYRQLASAGVKEAMVPCGYCYEMGKGTPGGMSNLDLAIYWYEQAGSYTSRRVDWCKRKKAGYRETEYENRLAYEIEPVVNKTHGKEYYTKDVNFTKFVYNGQVYYTNGVFLCVSSLDGNDIRTIAAFEQKYLYYNVYLAVNDTGIYLYTSDEETGIVTWSFDFSGNLFHQTELPNPESALDDATFWYDCVYVYGHMLYYVLREEGYNNSGDYVSNEKICSLDMRTGQQSVLYQKATAIRKLYANAEYLVFNAYYEDENDEDNWNDEGWMLYHLASGRVSCLSCSNCNPENVFDHPAVYNSDSPHYIKYEQRQEIKIVFVDLARNLMWVERETYEGQDSGHLQRVLYWEAKPLINGQPCNINLQETPIWRTVDDKRSCFEYFDGIHHYFGDSYYTFFASDKQGERFEWGSTSHGCCDQVTVMGNCMFLDLEAYGEEQYELTLEESKPLRKTWFNDELPPGGVQGFPVQEESVASVKSITFDMLMEQDEDSVSSLETNIFGMDIDPVITSLEEENSSMPGGKTLTLVKFRELAKEIPQHRETLLDFRKNLPDRWDYNAFVGILLSVKGPKHGDAACMNMAIGQGDNFKCAENKLIEKNLMDLFMKYRGKRVDPTVTLQAVEDEIVAVAPEFKTIREYFDKIVIASLQF